MAQKIVVRIADKDYPYMVDNPEMEQRMRKAAEFINAKLAGMSARYPDKPMEDRLSNVAFNIAVTLQVAQDKMEALGAEVRELTELTGKYLEEK